MPKTRVANEIKAYMHCGKCLKQIPDGVSPKDWSRTQFGWTKKGFQIWCNRHDMNVGQWEWTGGRRIN